MRDPAALTRFFGTPRGGEVIQVRDDGDQLVTVDEHVLADAMHTVIAQRAREATRRAAVGLLGVSSREDEAVLVLDDGEPNELFVVDEHEIKQAMATVISQCVGRELRAALNHLTGRIDQWRRHEKDTR